MNKAQQAIKLVSEQVREIVKTQAMATKKLANTITDAQNPIMPVKPTYPKKAALNISVVAPEGSTIMTNNQSVMGAAGATASMSRIVKS